MSESNINVDAPSLVNPDDVFEQYKDSWYKISTDYWAIQTSDVNGMLGGFRELTGVDVLDSGSLIEKYQSQKRNPLGNGLIADCGCGIGRVSHYVLVDYFKAIDLVDPVEHFIDTAMETMKDDKVALRKFVAGIQDWEPACKYDAFWVQWAIMYLTDADAIAFLKRCKEHLKPNGLIFIKDNIADGDLKWPKNKAQFFVEDRGICRAYCHYIELFEKAGMKVVESVKQEQWPEDLLPLYTFVLK